MRANKVAKALEHILKNLTRELVDSPHLVLVSSTISNEGQGGTIVLTVRTGKGDIGKVIGKNGKTANAIRVLLEAIAAKAHQRVFLEIDDSPSS